MAAVVLLIVNSCKKELFPTTQTPPAFLIERAKLFYNEQTNALPNLARKNQGANTQAEYKKEPKWTEARMEMGKDGESLMTVPFEKYELGKTDASYVRKYVFEERKGNIADGKIVEVIGDADFIAEQGESVIVRGNDKQIEGLSGAVISYDLNYRYLQGHYYQSGRQVSGAARIAAKSHDKSITGNGQGKLASAEIPNKISYEIRDDEATQTCINWYLVVTYIDQYGDFVYSTETYLGTTCNNGGYVGPPPVGGGGEETVVLDCAGVPNGTAYQSDCGCIGGTTGKKDCASRDIIDSLTNPCFKKALAKVTGANFTNVVNDIIKKLGGSASVKVKVVQTSSMYSNGNPVTGRTTDYIYNAGKFSCTIKLNESFLDNSTQEYIVSTIIHETLHAYLQYDAGNTINHNLNHDEIANKYITPFTELLIAIYPSLNIRDATALAWSGLRETNLWKESFKLDTFKIGNTSNTMTFFEIQGLQTAHAFGFASNGTNKCAD